MGPSPLGRDVGAGSGGFVRGQCHCWGSRQADFGASGLERQGERCLTGGPREVVGRLPVQKEAPRLRGGCGLLGWVEEVWCHLGLRVELVLGTHTL